MAEVTQVSIRRRKVWRWVRNVSLIALFAFLAAWNVFPPNVIRTPVVLGRGNDAQLDGEPSQKIGNTSQFEAHVGTLNARNNTSTASSESHSNPAFLPDRSLVIFNESDHLLMERVGTELLAQLKKTNQFDRLEYYPSGYAPEPGFDATDLVLSLDSNFIKKAGIAGQNLKATVTATLGSSLAASNHHVGDSLPLPIVEHTSQITVEHESSLMGFESSSAKYTLQGKDIAEQLGKSISDRLKTFREKYQPSPRLPESLRPEFQAAPEFKFLQQLNAKRRLSSHGLMFCNETFWQFELPHKVEPQMNSVRDELIEAGWQLDHVDVSQPTQTHLHATRGRESVELFPVRKHSSSPLAADETQGPTRYVIRYLRRMESAEIQSAIDEISSGPNADAELLIQLLRFSSSEQRERILTLIEQNAPRSIDGWLVIAEALGGRGDLDACRKALLRATILLRTVTHPGDYDQRIKSLAKQQNVSEAELRQIDRETLKELGIVELKAAESPTEVTIDGNSAASFFLENDSEAPPMITVRVQSDGRTEPNSAATVILLEVSESLRSWSSQSAFQRSSKLQHQCSFGGSMIAIEIEKLDSDSFRVSAKLRK